MGQSVDAKHLDINTLTVGAVLQNLLAGAANYARASFDVPSPSCTNGL